MLYSFLVIYTVICYNKSVKDKEENKIFTQKKEEKNMKWNKLNGKNYQDNMQQMVDDLIDENETLLVAYKSGDDIYYDVAQLQESPFAETGYILCVPSTCDELDKVELLSYAVITKEVKGAVEKPCQ